MTRKSRVKKLRAPLVMRVMGESWATEGYGRLNKNALLSLFDLVQGSQVDQDVYQGIDVGDRVFVTKFGALNTKFFG